MKTQFLSKWKHRDASSLFDSMGRYTRFVLVSKYSLVLLAILLVVMVIVMPLINPDIGGIRIVFNSVQNAGKGLSLQPKMINPRYQGVDNKNNPFTVEAASAEQQDAHTVLLNQLKADLALEKDSWLALNADNGLWNMDTKNLKLVGHVQIFTGDGYQFTTDTADIDVSGGIAISNTPVQGQGALGAISAGGVIISERGKNVLFNAPVALRLYPGANRHE